MSDANVCDYCNEPIVGNFRLRAVGFTDFNGSRAPLVKTWCGNCAAPDDVDEEATRATLKAFGAQTKEGR